MQTRIVIALAVICAIQHSATAGEITVKYAEYCSVGTYETPASSCAQVVQLNPGALPGHAWIKNSTEEPVFVYCSPATQCCSGEPGWMRIASLDMTDPQQTCPPDFRQLESPKRLCSRRATSAGCSSVVYKAQGASYDRVCGKIISYQYGSPSGFATPRSSDPDSIEGAYVEGVSVTQGKSPRNHIWSFANGLQATRYGNNEHICPCSSSISTMQSSIPDFVGNDYFCETGVRTGADIGVLYTDNPLWNAHGCYDQSTCCSFNNPPWFCKQLPQPTTDDIEVRLCADEGFNNEDSPIEQIEIYIK